MAFPKHLSKEEMDALIAIIERNRWDRLRLRQENVEIEGLETVESEDTENTNDNGISADSVRLILFGAECPFMQSMIDMFKVMTVITYFNNPEDMISFCIDHLSIQNVIFDIDPPTDCYLSKDAFASLKMIKPSINVFVCSSRRMSLEVEHFRMYGAIIMEKPILKKQVQLFCEKYLT
jgi:hypothetical protein